MTTPTEALKAAIGAHQQLTESVKTTVQSIADQREKEHQAQVAAAGLNIPAPVA